MKPIRVLALIEATSITGPAKNLIEFASLARQASPSVEMIVATIRRPYHPSTDPFLDALKAQQIPCAIVREKSALDVSILGSLRELVNTWRPDLFQTHNVKSNFLTVLAGLHRRIPWIAWHHGYTQPSRKQHLYNQFDSFSLRFADRVVTVTNAFLPELARARVPPDRIEVIHNAIHPFVPTPPIPHPGIPGSRLLVAIGRLSKEKDHASLIAAVAGLPNTHLLIAGEGLERAALTNLAAERGVALTLVGQVEDVRPYLAAADLFVLPSLSEGSPNVLIEAMAAGLPIVATKVGGIPEIVTDRKHALLCPAGQSQALRESIQELIDKPLLAATLSGNARQRALSDFQPIARATRIRKLYQNILEGKEK